MTINEKKEKAEEMVEKAIKYYLKNGLVKSLDFFSDPKGEFKEEEFYVSFVALNGVVLIHGDDPNLNGQNLLNYKDENGVFLVQEIIKQAQNKDGFGWANYTWRHPVTGKESQKTTFVKKIPGTSYLIHVGVYLE